MHRFLFSRRTERIETMGETTDEDLLLRNSSPKFAKSKDPVRLSGQGILLSAFFSTSHDRRSQLRVTSVLRPIGQVLFDSLAKKPVLVE
ncbi:hypothetical protein Nepgr_014535 [Nepenthes gracilis]|uniref:Uncharacterized protein n=1 Tax=Nepenthes gracilis TaxID=150966 RepID=A0AAD3SKZ3_NEPGR|nr:hypothetical protein Nepgr_014535 [Nepenthes gracilis]